MVLSADGASICHTKAGRRRRREVIPSLDSTSFHIGLPGQEHLPEFFSTTDFETTLATRVHQCEVPYPDNSMEPTIEILHRPLPGSCKSVVLKTLKVVAREKWAFFLPPDSIISHINTIPNEGGRILTRSGLCDQRSRGP
jgi:hypothetical protein